MKFALFRARLKPPLIVLGGIPRVNLLPPAVVRHENERRNRRLLTLLVLAVIAGVIIAGDVSDIRVQAEQKSLARIQAASAALLATERNYSAASSASVAAGRITDVLECVGRTDILWVPFLQSLRQAIVVDAEINSTSSVSAVSWDAAPAATTPLEPKSIATTSVVITFASLDKLEPIVKRLIDVPGVLAATPGAVSRSVTQTAGTYSTTITLNIGQDAFSKRFTGGRVQGSK